MAALLRELARTLQVQQRLRFVPPVPSHEVPAYLAGADVGISPILGDDASYDMALPNKLFEFVHAGLPIVTSDVAAMSRFVRENRLGNVFRQGDAGSCAKAVSDLLADPPTADTAHLRRTYSWQGQEQGLVDVYRGMAQERPALADLEVSDVPWTAAELAVEFG
jgi:glycosyltransferase involved in cell wall biosynthesis